MCVGHVKMFYKVKHAYVKIRQKQNKTWNVKRHLSIEGDKSGFKF